MNNIGDGLFQKMCKEAMEDLASGEKGSWREMQPNVLIMACFGMLTNHLTSKLLKPIWFFAGSIAAAAIVYIVRSVLFGG